MYKLLTTTAVILAVATPSLADEWTSGKNLTTDLETIYQNLDGQTQFDTLQGETGELNLFFNEVDKGVTHLTLNVSDGTDGNIANTIQVGIVGGSSFTEIETRATNLVNRINYDLFVETDTSTYDVNGGYAVINHNITGDGSDTGNNDYQTDQSNGLVGVKVTEVVDGVNDINDGLLGTGLTETTRQEFITNYGAGTGTFNGVDIADFQGTVTELNTAIETANDSGGGFFGNNGLSGFTEESVNNYVIPSYNNFEDIGNAGLGGYTSISAWANGVQSVTVGDKTGTVATTGTITIVSAEAGSESISDGTDTFTWDADSSSFIK